ncbi:MAG: hypothetical protein AAGC68_13550, partial [Verrucomicrobiota bacterium]
NGGTANATSGGPVTVLGMTVGDIESGGNGTLTFDSVDLAVAQDLNISGAPMLTVAGAQAVSGSVSLSNTSSLSIGGGSFDLKLALASPDGTTAAQSITSDGDLVLDGVGTISIGADAEMGLVGTGNSNGLGDASILADALLSVNNGTSLSVGEDLEVSRVVADESEATGSATASSSLLISNLTGSLSVSDDFWIGRIETGSGTAGPVAGTANSNATATLSNLGTLTVGNNFEVGISDLTTSADTDQISGSSTVGATAAIRDVPAVNVTRNLRVGALDLDQHSTSAITGTIQNSGSLTFTRVAATIGGSGITTVGVVDNDGSTAIATGSLSNSGSLVLEDSSLSSPEVMVGTVSPDVTASVSALLSLENAFVDTNNLELGPGGTLLFAIGGTTRLDSGSVGTTSGFSAIDAEDALLEGTIVLDFTAIPPGGTTTYDLIVTNSPIALDDANFTFTASGLENSFSIESLEVVTEAGADILRLTVVGIPVIPDMSVGRRKGRLFGDDVYNTSGSRQSASLRIIDTFARPFVFSVQNDGTETGVIRVSVKRVAGVRLTAKQGNRNVTSQLRRGLNVTLASSESQLFKGRVKAETSLSRKRFRKRVSLQGNSTVSSDQDVARLRVNHGVSFVLR